jgi:hypothetical protein
MKVLWRKNGKTTWWLVTILYYLLKLMYCKFSNIWRKYCLVLPVVSCRLVEVYWHFRGACCLHHQGSDGGNKHLWNVSKLLQTVWCYNLEDSHLQQGRGFVKAIKKVWRVSAVWYEDYTVLIKHTETHKWSDSFDIYATIISQITLVNLLTAFNNFKSPILCVIVSAGYNSGVWFYQYILRPQV